MPEANHVWEFAAGRLGIHITEMTVSAIGVDQPYEENSARIKGNWGIVGIAEDEWPCQKE